MLSEAPNTDYTLIEINRDNSKLYELNNKRVTPLAVKDYPATVQDALGTEVRGGELNFSGKAGSIQYHGHNETSQEKKIDQERYYRFIIDLIRKDSNLATRQLILMGLPQNINLFKKLNNGLPIANVKINQSVQNLSPTEIAKLVNGEINQHNRLNTADAITNTFRDKLFTDFTNIQNLLNSKEIRHLFVASRNEISQNDPDVYNDVNQMIKQALAQDTNVTVVNENSSIPLVSAV